ncbi:tumor necrosis factor ligand superfamily member 11 [Nerophis lumbriciformis]|uniref:tumor necrosis factor ligand superfamily member 11 n=1 Tax=Nerophis lumbriciformis TaxID=546530 RepID=UPI002AE08F45|nr:tumor necrosis factor ligand superfamily member 11-like [Nerophis lumbriciformis]
MAATHGEYRGYLRSTMDVEAAQQRFQPVASSEPSHRPLLFGTLAVMGLLQVASSVAILLHLTGYLQEVDLTTAPHRPIEEVQTDRPVLNALRDTSKNRFKNPKDKPPSAHLPIKEYQEFSKKGEPKAITIDWDEVRGYRHRMNYEKGKLLVVKSGFYYVYAKTCFRYYKYVPEDGGQGGGGTSVDVSNTQLIQYIYHERIKQNSKVDLLMKTGSTMRWDNTSYNMYCAQQGRGLWLDQGDALFVTVSNAWMLDPEGVGTYFGAVKLGN